MDDKTGNVYISAHECNLQEFHCQITSNYDHLCKLGNSKKSSSQIKPFLDCYYKIFCILTAHIPFENNGFDGKYFIVDYNIQNITNFPAINLSDSFVLSDIPTREKGI